MISHENLGEFPHHAMLGYLNSLEGGYYYGCGGSLINKACLYLQYLNNLILFPFSLYSSSLF